jgi:hypothetical protein
MITPSDIQTLVLQAETEIRAVALSTIDNLIIKYWDDDIGEAVIPNFQINAIANLAHANQNKTSPLISDYRTGQIIIELLVENGWKYHYHDADGLIVAAIEHPDDELDVSLVDEPNQSNWITTLRRLLALRRRLLASI